jgi:hypothetical protein
LHLDVLQERPRGAGAKSEGQEQVNRSCLEAIRGIAAGFECSTHLRRHGRRVDVIAATAHDRFAERDYRLVARHGMAFVRDGLRWHLIEQAPGEYDWSSFLPMLHGAARAGMTVVWDLMHFGWPGWISPWHPDWAQRFSDFAGATAALIRSETGGGGIYVPVNEISFLSWCGGEVGHMNPFARRSGNRLKRVLVEAFLRAAAAVRAADPEAVISCSEPLIRVHPSESGAGRQAAQSLTRAQFDALDMLLGRKLPELGGSEEIIDLIGLNYYPGNQWEVRTGAKISRNAPRYAPLQDLLGYASRRYERPLWIAETGCEGDERPNWFRYVCEEVAAGRAAGADIRAICLYPILNHPGWDDGRYCPNGLYCGVAPGGLRPVYDPLAAEVARQQRCQVVARSPRTGLFLRGK